ncbi:hypothetical protein HDV03_005393 [Kappamyces sp. JEL0829]|nr:hypothetical protein HDV03_005393 [Kappamyces sp. JEL0829]
MNSTELQPPVINQHQSLTPDQDSEGFRQEVPEAEKKKKPMNAFFVYRNLLSEKIKLMYGTRKSHEVSKIAGECWSVESKETKSIFRNLSILLSGTGALESKKAKKAAAKAQETAHAEGKVEDVVAESEKQEALAMANAIVEKHNLPMVALDLAVPTTDPLLTPPHSLYGNGSLVASMPYDASGASIAMRSFNRADSPSSLGGGYPLANFGMPSRHLSLSRSQDSWPMRRTSGGDLYAIQASSRRSAILKTSSVPNLGNDAPAATPAPSHVSPAVLEQEQQQLRFLFDAPSLDDSFAFPSSLPTQPWTMPRMRYHSTPEIIYHAPHSQHHLNSSPSMPSFQAPMDQPLTNQQFPQPINTQMMFDYSMAGSSGYSDNSNTLYSAQPGTALTNSPFVPQNGTAALYTPSTTFSELEHFSSMDLDPVSGLAHESSLSVMDSSEMSLQ